MLSFIKMLVLVGILLLQTACVQARPNVDYKALADLIKRDQITAFREALKGRTKADINLQGQTTLTALAISQNRTDCVAALLDWGVDVNRTLAFELGGEVLDITPLIYAISSKSNLAVVELLVQRGADVNKAGETLLPLNFALSLRQYATANYLIDRGADVNGAKGAIGMTPVMELSFYTEPDTAAMKELFVKMVRKGAKINTKTAGGTSALWSAVYLGKNPLVELLLESGAEPNTVNGKGQSVLTIAKQKQREDVAATLIKYGAKP
jgi:ankyrin repeat protein